MATKEYEIFSQYLANRNREEENLFVRLSSTEDLGIRRIRPISLYADESFSQGSPTVSIEFIDGNGDFVNHVKPNPDSVFYLDFGKNLEDSVRYSLKISKIVLGNSQIGNSDKYSFKIFFVHSAWNVFINERRNRSWINKAHSDVVRDLVAGAGFKELDIPTSASRFETYIQPYWSNLQTVKHLARKAFSSNGGHMEFGCSLTGKFIFKSTGDMIESQKSAARKKQLTTFRMEGQSFKETEVNEGSDKNKNNPRYIAFLTGEQDYVAAVTNGAGGAYAMYFDTTTGIYNRVSVKFSNLTSPQLADWAAVQENHETTGFPIYGGRASNSVNEAANRVNDVIDNMCALNIITEGAPNMQIGQMVEVLIPIPADVGSSYPYNVYYSGFYLVSAVRHSIDFEKSIPNTAITLMREGFDGKRLGGYIKSAKGKFITQKGK